MSNSQTAATPLPRASTRAAAPRRFRLPQSLQLALGAIVIAAAVWLVYSPSIHAPLIFDDTATLVCNTSIARLWPLVGTDFARGPLNPQAGIPTAARPLVNLSLAVNYYFGRLDPAGYRITSIALHIATALLLWAVVRRTLRLDYFHGRFERASESLSFAAALVWALHPLVTESVAYVTQRTELMMAWFYLATLYASLRYWSATRRGARTTWLALASAACLLGMFSKEMMASAPVMVWLFERTFVAGSFHRALRNSWPLYAGLAVGWLAWGVYTAAGPRTPLAGFNLGIDASDWWLTQCQVLWLYLKLAVWPWPLVIHYEVPLLASLSQAWPWVLATALLALTTLVLVWRRTAAGFVGAWVFAILSPTLVIPLVTEFAAERRMYLPLAAMVALAVVGVYAGISRVLEHRSSAAASRAAWLPLGATMAGALALAVVFSLVSSKRLVAYNDEVTLWSEAAVLQPHNVVARVNVGNLLARAGRQAEAIEYLEDALRVCPESMWGQYNLARALEESGRTQEAMQHYREAMRVEMHPANRWYRYDEGCAAARANLGGLLAREGKTEQAVALYHEALRWQPNCTPAHNNLAIALVSAGQVEQAVPHFEQALRHYETIEGYTNLANAYALVGRKTDAIAMAAKAVELARAKGETELADRIESHLQVYRGDAEKP